MTAPSPGADRGMPPLATDCHAHVFDPVRFPYSPLRRYTPPPASVDALLRLHERIGLQRVVLVQPSVYATDNACMLSALARLGARARGVAVIDTSFDRARLEDLYGAGVRGVRLNLQVAKGADPADALRRVEQIAEALGGLPLLIQVYAALPIVLACAALLRALRQQVLIDHFGLAQASGGTGQHGFSALLELLSSANVWIKLSGPYQISERAPAYDDVAPIAQALLAAAPQRVVWGSDWPHTGGSHRPAQHRPTDIEPFRPEDDARNLRLTEGWASDPAARQRLLVDNPARLFGFAGG